MTFATVSSDLRINSGLLWLTVIPGLPLLVYLLRDVSFIVGLLVFALLLVLYIVIQRFTSGIDLDDLEKRAVFITGCDTGFGNLLALKCLGRGIPVFAGCLTEQGAEDLRTAAKNLPGYLDTVLVNVASTESVAAAAKYLDEATAKYGGLHAIVNNAGVFGSTFFDDFLNVEQYKEIAEVNTFGVIRVTQAMKHLVKQTRGRVVTMSSAAARVGAINMGPYTMSKFAVSGYCEVIRQELKYFGVSVHVLEPGIFNTPMAAVQNINAWLLRSIGKQTNPNVNVVVDAYFHAITSRFPHLRYQLGPDCQFLYLPLSYMPTGLRDAIFTVLEMFPNEDPAAMDSRLNCGLLWLAVIPGMPLLVLLLRDVPFIWGVAVFAALPVLYLAVQRALKHIEIEHLEKRAVFITGCDTGFGNLLALKCARRGMPVFAGCLTKQGAEDLLGATASLPGKVETILLDVASDKSVAAAAKYLEIATEKYGGLHAVVNNAGIMGATFFDDLLNVDQYKEVVEINTFGVIRVTQALKHLVKKTRGRIVTISSASGRLGFIGMGPYTVSKHAVSGYCEVIRQELKYFGVSVHILEPGVFKTPMAAECNVKARLDSLWEKVPSSTKEEYGECFFQKCRGQLAKGIGMFADPRVDVVVDAYFHALTARFPNLRYQLGLDCQFMMMPMSCLPTGLRDALFTVGEVIFKVPVPKCAQ
ncbi:hypothetical protein PRIPAC_79022 [Pristionchus pacificus]|uniref:Dehydrogenase n=1 Tax=Pristionchus pacificus TaxID=54126 RepID=A0A2A6CL13_PRIPA|nr:hypothetical protein PRIPAC_79022 [Pristionchus pacificus]|eukprot:PDM78904.1 dehydrogenase [Pristionchus pacificus]